MVIKSIKFFYNKHFLLFILISLVFSVLKLSYNNSKILNNQFKELNNIELYISSDSDYIDRFINQFNLDEKSYAYIDNSKDLLLYNSLKNKSSNYINIYSDLFSTPDIYSLFQSISTITANINNNIEIIELLDKIVDVLSVYFNADYKVNKNIGLDLIKSMVVDTDDYSDFIKINVIFKQNINNKKDLEYMYMDFFDFLKSFQLHSNDFKYIKFYNNYIYSLFDQYNAEQNLNILSSYQDVVVFYSDDINSPALLFDVLNKENIYVESILDYLTDKSLRGQKYKQIKRLNYNASSYDKEKNTMLKYQGINNILNSIDDIGKNITEYKMTQNLYGDIKIDKIIRILTMIEDEIKANMNNYKVNFLISNYNENAQEFIQNIANTEPVTLDFVNPYIYKYYSNSSGQYTTFVDCKESSYCKDYIIKEHGSFSSLYVDRKNEYLNLSYYIFLLIYAGFFIYHLVRENK